MLRINIHEAKTQLSKYAKRVKAGETIWLCDRNKPFAEIRPLSPAAIEAEGESKGRPIGIDKGAFSLPTDWDSPELNETVRELFEGRE